MIPSVVNLIAEAIRGKFVMKKPFKALLSLAVCLTLVFSMALSAAADRGTLWDKIIARIMEMEDVEEQNVSISGNLIEAGEVEENWAGGSWTAGAKPSAADILATGDDIYIKMPHESYYLDEYEYKYVNDRANKNSVYVFDNPDNGINAKYLRPRAYHGSRVIVLAERQIHSCVLYWTADNVMHAGWVSSENLQDEFPGVAYSVGKLDAKFANKGVESFVPAQTWSELPAADTGTKYTIVNNGGRKCISVTLDYHIIGRNGVVNLQGAREVYCLVEGEWINAGEFEVDKNLTPVMYTIYFRSPVELEAFLIVPKDLNTQGFDVRQQVVEMCCLKE